MGSTVSTLTLKINVTQAAAALKNLQQVSVATLNQIGGAYVGTGRSIAATITKAKELNTSLRGGTGFAGLVAAAKAAQKDMDIASARMFQPLIDSAQEATTKATYEIKEWRKDLGKFLRGEVTDPADMPHWKEKLNIPKKTAAADVPGLAIKTLSKLISDKELSTFESINESLTKGTANARAMGKAIAELAGDQGFIKLADAARILKISDVDLSSSIRDVDTDLKKMGGEVFVSVNAVETLGVNLTQLRETLQFIKTAFTSTGHELRIVKDELKQATAAGNIPEMARLGAEYEKLAQRLRDLANIAKGSQMSMVAGDIVDPKLLGDLAKLEESLRYTADITDTQLNPTLEKARAGLVSVSIAARDEGISYTQLNKALTYAIAQGQSFTKVGKDLAVTATEARGAWQQYTKFLKDEPRKGFKAVYDAIQTNVINANSDMIKHVVTLKGMHEEYAHVDEGAMVAVSSLQEYGRAMMVLNTSIKEQLTLTGESASSWNQIGGVITSLGKSMENLYGKTLDKTLNITALKQQQQDVVRILGVIEELERKMRATGGAVDQQAIASLTEYKKLLKGTAEGLDIVLGKEMERRARQELDPAAAAIAKQTEAIFQTTLRGTGGGAWNQLTKSLSDAKLLLDSNTNAWYLFRRVLAGSRASADPVIKWLDKMGGQVNAYSVALGPANARLAQQTYILRDNMRQIKASAVAASSHANASEHFSEVNKELLSNIDALTGKMNKMKKASDKGESIAGELEDSFRLLNETFYEVGDASQRFTDSLTDAEKDVLRRYVDLLGDMRGELEFTSRLTEAAAKETAKFGVSSTAVGRTVKRTADVVKTFGKVIIAPARPVVALTKGVANLGKSMVGLGKTTSTTGKIFAAVFGANLLSRFVYDIKHTLVRGLRNAISEFVAANDAFASFRASMTGIISGRGGFADATERIKAINEESTAWFQWAKDVIASSSLEVVDVLQTIPQMMKYGFNPEEWLYPMIEMAASFNEPVDRILEGILALNNNLPSWRKTFYSIGVPLMAVTAWMKKLSDGTYQAAAHADVYDEATGNLKKNLKAQGYEELKLLNANNELNHSVKDSVELMRGWAMQSSMVVGQAEEQAKTWEGAVSNLKDAMSLMSVALGVPIFNRLSLILREINKQIAVYSPYIDQILGGLGGAISRVLELMFEWIKVTGNAQRVFLSFWKIIESVVKRDPELIIKYLKGLVIGFVSFVTDLISGLASMINRIISGEAGGVRAIGEELGEKFGAGFAAKFQDNAFVGFDYGYGKEKGKEVGDGIADGLGDSSAGNIFAKTFANLTGTGLQDLVSLATQVGSTAVSGIDTLMSFVLGNIEKVGEEAVGASYKFKIQVLQALSVSGGTSDLTTIATEYAQKFLGPLASVAEFVRASMAAVVAGANLDRIKSSIEAAERTRDAAIKIIEAETTQIRDQISGLQRRESNFDKEIQRIETMIDERVAEQLRNMGIVIDEQLIERLQLQLDLLQFEYDMNNNKLEALVKERESRGVKVMSQEEIQLRANQQIFEDRLKQLQMEISVEEKKLKQRDLLAAELRIQYADQVKAIEAQKEATAKQIEALQTQLDAKNEDKVEMEKRFAQEREIEQAALSTAQAIADQTATAVSTLSEVYSSFTKSAEDTSEALTGVFSGLPSEIAEAFNMDDLEAKIAAAMGTEQQNIADTLGRTLHDFGNALVDLIASVTNMVIQLFGGKKISVPKYQYSLQGGASGIPIKTEQSAFDRLALLVDGIEDLAGLSEDNAFRKIPDLITRMDDITVILLEWLGMLRGGNVGTVSAEAVKAGAKLDIVDQASMFFGTGLSALFEGEEKAAERLQAFLIRKGADPNLFAGVEASAESTTKAVEDKFSKSVIKIRSDLAATDNPVTEYWQKAYTDIYGRSIVPDMINGIISEFGRLNTWLQSNVISLSAIASNYNAIFGSFGAFASMPNISSLGSVNLPTAGGFGGGTFIFAPQLYVSGEVDKAAIADILTEQQKEFGKTMRNFVRQEIRR